MSLDSRPSDAALRAMLAEKEKAAQPRTLNGIVLGPGSPVHANPAPRKQRSRHELAVRRGAGPTEHELQVAVFEWVFAEATQAKYPDVALAFGTPNGGHRTVAAAVKMKAEGQRPGIPDIWLPARRRDYVGLVIEMKRQGGSTSPEQRDWLAALARQGWKTALHTTTDGAIAEMIEHLERPVR